jgi:hypothetical protein
MSIIKRMRRQTAVWWARGVPDRYGKFSFSAPVEIKCRWDGSGSEFRNKGGQIEISAATVYPDRVLKIGDELMLGDLESDTPEDPSELKEAFEIMKFETTPNLKATEFLYTAYL